MPAAGKKHSRGELLSELARLQSDSDRRKFLSRHTMLVRAEVVKKLSELVVEKIRVDTREALQLADAALSIARKLRRKENLALGLWAKANALYACGDNRAAVEHHEQALELYESLGLWKEAARTLSSSIQPLILLGEYDRAFQASERAREIFARLGETRHIARLENNVGNIFHRQDRFEEALAHYERAYKALSEYQEWERVAIALHNMAMCLISLNDFSRSLDCYQKSRELCERYGMPLLRDQADYNIAYLYYFRGEYSRAIEMLFATRRACEVTGDAYHLALCHLRKVEMAESEMIGVTRHLAGAPRGKKHFDGAAILAAEIVQVGDVVVRLVAQQRHSVPLARFACFPITVQRAGKVIQTDQAHRHVAEDDGNTLRVLIRQQIPVSALVMSDGFIEAILPVKDVAEIDFETCETPRIVETCEDFSGPSRSFERLIVLTQQDQRLD